MTEWVLTSSVLILLVLAVRGLFKNRMKAKNIYALWLLVLLRLLCPVNFGELSFNLLSLAEEAKEEVFESHNFLYSDLGNSIKNAQYSEACSEMLNDVLSVEDAAIVESPMESENTVVTKEPGFSFPKINWKKVVSFAWIAGMAMMLVVIFSVNISFSTTLGLFRKQLPVLEKKGNRKQKVSVYLADGIVSSCLYGVIRPSIYLNRTGMSEQEKTYCVEHEYSHYLQGDMVWSLCRALCLILHWYNPLVWLAVMLSKKDAELACDERTIERLGEEERYRYGHTLVELAAAQSRVIQMFGMATLMASDEKEVVDRVKAITTKKQTKIVTGILVAVLVVGIGFFVFTGEAKDRDNNKTDIASRTETDVPVPSVTVAVSEENSAINTDFSQNKSEEGHFPKDGYAIKSCVVRSEASMSGEFVTWLYSGFQVTVLDVEEDWSGTQWCKVMHTEQNSSCEGVGYVKSDDIIYPGTFRLYEEKNKDGAYTELFYYPYYIGIVDVGDECWFRVGTLDGEKGWVLFGEHEYVDDRILEKLQFYKEVQNNITYQTLSVNGCARLSTSDGEGWLVDLDGDGTEEHLYVDENSVQVDGKIRLIYPGKKYFWLLDYGFSDGTYALMDSTGSVYAYENGEFYEIMNMLALYEELEYKQLLAEE